MVAKLHTITVEPWRSLNFSTRVALEATSAIMWPLNTEDRLTALITLLGSEIEAIAENDEQIDAVIDVLRQQMRLQLARQH